MQFIHITKNRVRFLLLLVLLNISMVSKAQSTTTIGVDDKLGTLVTTEWLSQHLNDPDLVVLDCTVKVEYTDDGSFRSVSGLPGYESGHIPSAGFADLITDLSDTSNPLQFTMPSAEQFVEAMGALGVGDNTRVVLYDSGRSVWAARVWWMLRWVGFDRVALLDGGLPAWTAAGHPLSTEPAKREARQLTANLRPELIADRDEVYAAIGNQDVHIIDAMPESHYRGEMVMYDWPGHIPGASNTPSSSLVDDSGHYLPHEDLVSIVNGDSKQRTITYCGGGIAASSNAFILTRLGFTDVAVYMGSLQEWTADTDNPMEVETP